MLRFGVAGTLQAIRPGRYDHSERAVLEAPQHDGSVIKLRKLTSEFDATDKGKR